MSKNCIFVLTKNHSLYYDGKKILIYRKYSQELEHIWKSGYDWDTGHTKDMMEVWRDKK